ncbi:sensor histidine kinase [Paraburkholderia sp. CNPSo 3274]|uniref:ATP-binding protein n=1 Tax=Paraburkholderia sp. CNPSo 3274 TaxID=2940932 RepID=UPI0020B86874|nr:sensor histidine kinase [Paraburkholderia sp. CNPSo 3274]MCP3712391.1 sensor histidine kinase [Paraburkholderia sp. CNPSo 3274]
MKLPAWVALGRGLFVPASSRAAPNVRDSGHEHWQTTTFRWFTAYATIFSLAFMALLGVIEYSVTRAMMRETDSGLRWQLRYFDSRIDNAIKFAPQGGVVSVTLRSTPLGPLLEVADNGPGIAPGERAAVLQRFYRGEAVRHIAGSGLGLCVVAAVVRVHDFTLRINDARELAGEKPGGPGTRMSVECWPRSLA